MSRIYISGERTLVYKCLNNKGPRYLAEMLTPYQPVRSLRSAEKALLQERDHPNKLYGERAFATAGPKLWNSLPQDIRQSSSVEIFKSHLKTYLFKNTFNI